MTTIELRTSIAAELDQMSVEMLESVSRFHRGNPWYATDEEVDKLRQEYLAEKYK